MGDTPTSETPQIDMILNGRPPSDLVAVQAEIIKVLEQRAELERKLISARDENRRLDEERVALNVAQASLEQDLIAATRTIETLEADTEIEELRLRVQELQQQLTAKDEALVRVNEVAAQTRDVSAVPRLAKAGWLLADGGFEDYVDGQEPSIDDSELLWRIEPAKAVVEEKDSEG